MRNKRAKFNTILPFFPSIAKIDYNMAMQPEKKEFGLKKYQDHPIWELVKFAFFAFLIVLPVRLFIAQPFIVAGHSMDPTFADKDYLIVDEISYRFKDPARGDVTIFRYPKNPKIFYIKRIIGLPGETVEVKDGKIIIKNAENPDGLALTEPYINDDFKREEYAQTLKEDEYFVMGDNRSSSSDSRYWGALPKKNIIGRAFLRLFPPTQISVFPGEHDNYDEIAK